MTPPAFFLYETNSFTGMTGEETGILFRLVERNVAEESFLKTSGTNEGKKSAFPSSPYSVPYR